MRNPVNKNFELMPDGERFLAEMKGVIHLEHWHRYRLASQLCADKTVLDLASGEGYGSHFLAKTALNVIGFDISEKAVFHATQTYQQDNLRFGVASATEIPLEDNSIDLIVSFETIEHLEDHEGMIREFKRVLKNDGVILISSPNKEVYSDIDGYRNPYHVRELYTEEFHQLIKSYFENTKLLGQRTAAASIIAHADALAPFASFQGDDFRTGVGESRYDIILASDSELPHLPNSVFDDQRSDLTINKLDQMNNQALNQIKIAMTEVERLKGENIKIRQENDRLKKTERLLQPTSGMIAHTNLIRSLKKRSQKARRAINMTLKKCNIEYKLLSILSSTKSPLSARTKARFARSAAKRAPMSLKHDQTFGSIRTIPSFRARTEPKLVVVVMARNEAKRLDDSMRHLCALFDRIVVVDHLSTDNTAQIAERYNQMNNTEVLVLRGEDAGYYQSEYMTSIANALILQGNSEWIFFLDVDEFLPFQSATEFRQALTAMSDFSVINMHWLNLALLEYDLETLQGAKAVTTQTVSEFVKIALNATRLSAGKVEVLQGNHAAIIPGSSLPTVGERSFGLFHVPFSGLDSLRFKVEQGSRVLSQTQGKDKQLGSHWRDLHDSIDKVSADPKLAREVSLNYGKPLVQIFKSFSKGELTVHSRPLTLEFAQTTKSTSVAGKTELHRFTLDNIDDVLGTVFSKSIQKIEAIEKFGQPQFQELPIRVFNSLYISEVERIIADAILSAATEIEVIVPTAWQGHIPFLFTLMEVQRPRRYVELGTHAGASLFAACQHISSNGNYGEAIGIDLWTGDHQAGHYDERVFNNFKQLLNLHFPKTGKFLRGYFSDALASFQDNSIDLLHIDGLHTYDAVKEDYETWLPKLAENGVIIFHDTNEFQTDFGVWQLFNEVRGQAVESFQFRHGHGLGIMAFGGPEGNPVIELVKHLNANAAKVESYYATLSQALFSAARYEFVK